MEFFHVAAVGYELDWLARSASWPNLTLFLTFTHQFANGTVVLVCSSSCCTFAHGNRPTRLITHHSRSSSFSYVFRSHSQNNCGLLHFCQEQQKDKQAGALVLVQANTRKHNSMQSTGNVRVCVSYPHAHTRGCPGCAWRPDGLLHERVGVEERECVREGGRGRERDGVLLSHTMRDVQRERERDGFGGAHRAKSELNKWVMNYE